MLVGEKISLKCMVSKLKQQLQDTEQTLRGERDTWAK